MHWEKGDRQKKVDDADVSDLIESIDKKLRKTTYQLSTLMADGEMNTQLFNGISEDIELLDGLPRYWKIMCKKEIAPAKVSIEYLKPEEFKSFKLNVFVSYSDASPSKKSYVFKFFNKKNFNLYPLNSLERKFKSDYIYFALESINGCSLKMRVEFSSEKQEQDLNKDLNMEEGFDSPFHVSQFSVNFNLEGPEPPQTDKIKEYINNMKVWKQVTNKQRTEKQVLRDRRIQSVLRKKKVIFKQDLKKHIVYLNKWE